MSIRTVASLLAASVSLLGPGLAGCGEGSGGGAPATGAVAVETGPAAPRPVLERVAALGASATFGFNAQVTDRGVNPFAPDVNMAKALDAMIVTPHERPSSFGTSLFFENPVEYGGSLLAGAQSRDPSLVVAVDFIFWYGYGALDVENRGFRDNDPTKRMALLEKGLEMLQSHDCPLVLGDFPDMTPAVGYMLRDFQVPTPETLDALNARLYEWAAERPDVIVLPLADFVAQIRADNGFSVNGNDWPAGSEETIFQWDHLHPTGEGLVAMAQLVASALIESGHARPEDFDLDSASVLEKLRAKANAVHDAEEAAAAPAGAGP